VSAVLILLVLVSGAAGVIQDVTTPQTMQQIIDGGNTLQVGLLEFSSFQAVTQASPSAYYPEPDELVITGIHDTVTGDYGLRFEGTWRAVWYQENMETQIDYEVSADPGYVVAASSLALVTFYESPFYDEDYLTVVKDVYDGDPDAGGGLVGGNGVWAEDDAAVTWDSDPVAPALQSAWVRDVVFLQNDADEVSLGEFQQFFGLVPEPATLALVALGAAAAAVRRRKRA
jgi:hypothetical protein